VLLDALGIEARCDPTGPRGSCDPSDVRGTAASVTMKMRRSRGVLRISVTLNAAGARGFVKPTESSVCRHGRAGSHSPDVFMNFAISPGRTMAGGGENAAQRNGVKCEPRYFQRGTGRPMSPRAWRSSMGRHRRLARGPMRWTVSPSSPCGASRSIRDTRVARTLRPG